MSPLIVVIALLAAWRVARLGAIDEITRPIRERIAGRKPDGQLAYLITCPWCLSIWTTPLVMVWPVFFPTNRVLAIVCLTLAGSLLAGFGTTVEDRLDR